MRYTKQKLQEDVRKYNKWLADDGISFEFIYEHYNNRCAIDYRTTDIGNPAAGCDSNLRCGTPRECLEAVKLQYLHEVRVDEVRKLNAKVDELEAKLAEVS